MPRATRRPCRRKGERPLAGDDAELDALREKRLHELARQQNQAVASEAEAQRRAQERESAVQAVLRQVLEPDARERLQRVKIARPDQGAALEEQIVALAQSGRLRGKITDQDLKTLLARLFPPKRETKIRRLGEE